MLSRLMLGRKIGSCNSLGQEESTGEFAPPVSHRNLRLMGQRVVMSWSGGKDSALALHRLLSDPSIDVIGLLTTITEDYERISMHGVRVELLRRQAASVGLPVIEVWIPPGCTNEIYEARMARAY